LGVDSLVGYAKQTYGVTLSVDEARERRERLVNDIYPELALYLAEDVHLILARNLQASVPAVKAALGDIHLTCIRKVLEGDPKRNDGQPYIPAFVDRIWTALAGVNRVPELRAVLAKRTPDKALARRVCEAGVATLTGRIRGRVRYSAARNTPFQGLAADGAALALFALVKAGFRVVGFVHDEVLVELPDEGGYVSEAVVRRVENFLVEAMRSVLGCDLPVRVESSLSRRWSKEAGIVFKDGKAYPAEGHEHGKHGPSSPVGEELRSRP
jgi:hypothetical protein